MSKVVYLVQDLLFTSKIRETCSQLGHEAKGAPTAAALVEAAREAKMVIVDLRHRAALEALDALKSAALAEVTVVGFIDHEKVDLMEAARAKGCREVMAKGQFSSELPRLLTEI
jgi:hypothetical protein